MDSRCADLSLVADSRRHASLQALAGTGVRNSFSDP